MSHAHSLFRLKHPLKSCEADLASFLDVASLPFGDLDEVERRLLAFGGFERRSSKEEAALAAAMQDLKRRMPLLPGFQFPEMRLLRHTGGARAIDVTLWGDPVTSISMDPSTPEDLLPVVDALEGLGPFAISRDNSDTLGACTDPADLRPADGPGS